MLLVIFHGKNYLLSLTGWDVVEHVVIFLFFEGHMELSVTSLQEQFTTHHLAFFFSSWKVDLGSIYC
jgi:hypothetical protein